MSIKDVVACLYCRENHRKCDGKRPCFQCIRNKVECVENNKRKAVGRPKNELEKKIKTTEEIKCIKCSNSLKAEAVFCNNCGFRVPDRSLVKKEKLEKQLEGLKKKNMEYKNIIQSRKFVENEIWIMMRSEFPLEGKFQYPQPAYIYEYSNTLGSILGYQPGELSNIFYPDLFPVKHGILLDKSNFRVKLEIDPTIQFPIMRCFNDVYLKRSDGHTYAHFVTKTTIYMDNFSKLPSFKYMNIEKILDLCVSEEDIPNLNIPEALFISKSYDEIPDFIKDYCFYPVSVVNEVSNYPSFDITSIDIISNN